MMPMPPVCMRTRMMDWPVGVKKLAVSCTVRPVTQMALVLVKMASSHDRLALCWVQSGIFSRAAPMEMAPAK